jgi:hypothetical protein
MYCLDTLYLFGNPIVNNNSVLAKIENNSSQLKKAFDSYFGGSGSSLSSLGGLSGGIGSGISGGSGGSTEIGSGFGSSFASGKGVSTG